MEGFLSGIEKLAIDEMKEASMEQPREPPDNYGQSRQVYSGEIRIMIKPWSSRYEIVIKKKFGLRDRRTHHGDPPSPSRKKLALHWYKSQGNSTAVRAGNIKIVFVAVTFMGRRVEPSDQGEVLVQVESISNQSATD